MVSIVTKKIKGREYLYLVGSVREGSKVIQKTIKYIGPKRLVSKDEFVCMKISAAGKDWILNSSKDQLAYTKHNEMKKSSKQAKKYLQSLDSVSREKEMEKFLSIFIASSNAIEGSTMSAKETSDFVSL